MSEETKNKEKIKKKSTKQELKKTMSKKDFLLYEKEELELKQLKIKSELKKITTKEQQKKRKHETREKILIGSIIMKALKENVTSSDFTNWLSGEIQNLKERDLEFMQDFCNRFNIKNNTLDTEGGETAL
jgi:hypothetical protein